MSHAVGFTVASPEAELRRLDAHFIDVLRELETRPPPRLSAAQRRARTEHLARLDGYRRTRRFPKNRRFPGRRVPHFIDEAGTRCALGHLIEQSGARDLVQRIARERNFARVRELGDVTELLEWLDANGLTVREAARIQPSYCGTPAMSCLCSHAFASGYVAGTVGDAGASLTVSAIYGPVTGVEVGDAIPLANGWTTPPGELLFGNLYRDAFGFDFASNGGEVVLMQARCEYPGVSMIPGPLPLSVVEEALSAPDSAGCEDALAAHDASWGRTQGSCGGPGSGGAENAGGRSGAGGAETNGGTENAGGAAGPHARARSEDDGGCSAAPHPSPGAPAILVLSAAVLMGGLRRIHRAR